MNLVIDASIAVKWVVEEHGPEKALRLRSLARLIAPELLIAECANILWKKAERGELSGDEALFAARLLQSAEIELVRTRPLLRAAVSMALTLSHPAYDCLYLALAVETDSRFVTADERLARKLRQGAALHRDRVVLLAEIAGS